MRKLILTSICLLLLTNFVVLAGVAYNRSGEPLISIELTERELPIRQTFNSSEENSGTALKLEWQILDPDYLEYRSSRYATPGWLDDDKLIDLGFDLVKIRNDTDRYRYRTSHLATDVIVVLEYQGDTYQKELALQTSKVEEFRKRVANYPDDEQLSKKLDRFEKRLTQLKISLSRLYAIDAGLNMQDLMQQYEGETNLLFMRGQIGLSWSKDDVNGQIQHLYIKRVHVPLPFSKQLSILTDGKRFSTYSRDPIQPRYKIRLNIGKRIEPWIDSVSPMESVVQI